MRSWSIVLLSTYSILYLLYPNAPLYSQQLLKFEHIRVENGLSQSNINDILQDKQGFVWFATNGGLNRYDGTQFKLFTYSETDTVTLSSNKVNHLYEDKDGNILISTQNGLDIYDPNREVFTHFSRDISGDIPLVNRRVTCSAQDLNGNYWIGTAGGGLSKYDKRLKKNVTFISEPADDASISSNYITCIQIDNLGVIWVGTADNGLNKFNPNTNKFIRYKTTDEENGTSGALINALYIDSFNTIWIGTDGGLDLIETKSNNTQTIAPEKIIHVKSFFLPKKTIAEKAVLSIMEDRSGNIWFGTADSGLGHIKKDRKTLHIYTVDPNDEFSLLSNQISSVYEDNSGILWVGTNAGINVIDRMKDRFTWHKRAPGVGNTMSSNNIQSILKEKNGRIWLGSHDQGLTMYNPATDIFTTYLTNDFIIEGESVRERNRLFKKFDQRQTTTKPLPVYNLTHNRVNALLKDKNSNIWIGTGNGGINILGPGSGRISSLTHDPDDAFSLSSNNIRCMFMDWDGIIWIGTEDAGLNKYDGKIVEKYVTSEKDVFSISGNDVQCIAQDSTGLLWVGTFENGLSRFDPTANRFIRYFHIEKNSNSLSNNTIYSILPDKGKLWIGTADGLNLLDIANNTFTKIGKENGLASGSVYAILDDRNGNLWVSTNRGISSISKETLKVRNYGQDDGIQSTEFNPGATFRAQSGELFFGSLDGYCSFFPEKVTEIRHNPKILITDFRILNEKVPVGESGSPLKTNISSTDTLRLSYKHISISFEFVALNFSNARKTQYAYMMENFDTRWNYVDNRRYANYTNLPPGHYVFKVKASTSDGSWDENGRSVVIIIDPPFYKTWWFYVIATAFILIVVLLLIQWRTRYLFKSRNRLEEKVKVRTRQIKEKNKVLEQANKEILDQKSEIEQQNDLLVLKNEEISSAKSELDTINRELIDTNTNLEHIVEDRTSSLKDINQELKNANNELDTFIYRASHDLKGPIARLLGMTLLAKMDNKDEVLKEYILLIEKGAMDMNKTLNKLNNVHFINRETVSSEDIDVKKLIKDCTSELGNFIDPTDLEIQILSEPHFQVRTDYVLIKIIVENIIENAVIFRKTKQAKIEITLRTDKRRVIISIKDNGLGILKEQQERIFDMFYRGSERSKGNGLGLYLVRKAVQKLHGEVMIESEEGKYSCFTIALPTVIVPAELKSLVAQ